MAEETNKESKETQEELSNEELEDASGGVVKSLTQKFTMFKEDGTPLRAEVDLTLKQKD